MSKNNNLQSEVKETSDEDGVKKYLGFITVRDIALFGAGVVVLNWFAILDIPFVGDFDIPYEHVLRVIVVSVLVAYGAIWNRYKAWLDEKFADEWSYIAVFDAAGKYFSALKTHPDTLNAQNDYVRVEDKDGNELDVLEKSRQDMVVQGRKWWILKDIDYEEEQIVLTPVPDYPSVDDDQIIANKRVLRHVEDEVYPDAEWGRKARESFQARLMSARNRIARQVAVLHEHATTGSVLDPEEMFSETIEGYDRTELEPDELKGNMVREEVEEFIDEVDEQVSGDTDNQGES